MRDWVGWHEAYDDPSSPLAARLIQVRGHLSQAIDRARAGPVRLISLCAGQGRDVIGVLPGHPRRSDVHALLVELDQDNAALARDHAAAAGLSQVQVRQADASLAGSFADALPADILLLCGIFGNVSSADIKRTAEAAPGPVRAGRHRDLDPAPPAAGSDPEDPRLVRGQRLRRGRVRRARHRQPHRGRGLQAQPG
ncbi:MAG TPA: hypothetical protein VN840_11505 [Streptosporangiaceae bacterium]|nr:hypothetical protein [Streptosporangiaceae bacterium]